MSTKSLLRPRAWLALAAVVLANPAPAFSSFNLDYVVVGRIWIPSMVVHPDGFPRTDLVVALSDFGVCTDDEANQELPWKARDRDCRFEQQLADALGKSGMFRQVVRTSGKPADVDLVLQPRLSRVQFRREVISWAKPLLVLSFFTYLWSPLPVEFDVESYDLRVAILDPRGELQSEVAVAREFSHVLGTYSAERDAPEALLAQLEVSEKDLGPFSICRGPHSGEAVHELLQKLGAAVMRREIPGREREETAGSV